MNDSSISIQHQIRTQCETMTSSLKDMKKWEMEIKQKEMEMQATKADQKQNPPPLRNNLEAFSEYKTKTETSSINQDNKITEEIIDSKQRANEYKEKGNVFVKAQDYENAITMYSEAIQMNHQDPVFYSNRSQCYLKIEKYNECIEDTTQAIKLDSRLSKAYWRRMMAYEKLGEDILALKDCRVVMDLLPNEEKWKNDYDKIHNRIIEAQKKKAREMVKWSRLSKEAEITDYIKKSPHLRSKKPMKRIEIKAKKVFEQIPESSLKKTTSNKQDIKTPETDEPKTTDMPSLAELETQKCASTILLPKGGPQFHSVWKELSEQKRFLFLKNITDRNANIGKLLGASLDSYIFSEIVGIIDKYFAHYQISPFKLLKGLSENPEMGILGMMLPEEDKTILSKLLDNSICGDNTNTNELNEIKNKFCIS
ncbi:unnamed protein product [Diamesa tonsa]